eukprot:TRINITY_DN1351_c0_g2_i1.p1 TRINITY_DN1351_c0_g2~~TRINITY_DN1351_c0_g2_i1.p1  ORF type:complete len:927 (-),score=420.65 TRINITY_DN1351_c0_g2_i1:79-2859(-)
MLRFSQSTSRAGKAPTLCQRLFTTQYQSRLKGNGVVGIRREDKNRWERRAPLAPSHVHELTKKGIEVILQPSTLRIFPDNAYKQAGAYISEDLEPASLILGVKEVPIDRLLPERTYCFFSHTIKGQPYNMPLLDSILEKNIRLIDYERIVDSEGHRIVKFGKFAGYAGMIDFLHGLGNRLLALGYSTPFLNVGYMHMYSSLDNAKAAIVEMGKFISQQGLPKVFCPLSFVFTGTGAVSQGALEIFKLLPHKWVTAEELKHLVLEGGWDQHVIYATMASSDTMIVPNDRLATFDKADYYANPHKYNSVFDKNFAPYASVIVNSLYWDQKFPRMLTTEQYENLVRSGRSRLLGVADLSCDIEGSLEFMTQISSIDHPFFVYDVTKRSVDWNIATGKGVMFLGVDNLPTEIPVESTTYFGDALTPFIESLSLSDGTLPFEEQNDVHPSIKPAIITSHGKLTKQFEYITQLRETSDKKVSKKMQRVLLLGSGRVSGPVVEYFKERKNISITVASNMINTGVSVDRVENVELDVSAEDGIEKLTRLVDSHDIVISLLPPPLHPIVAEVCIDNKKPLVTTSYVSPQMKALHEKAMAAGVTILNEIGLDPGIDHLTAMRVINGAINEGSEVVSFTSYCGGLPAPEHSDNPFGYKFSWSPRGALVALKSASKFRQNGRIIEYEPGTSLCNSTHLDFFPGFNLEGYANRDSMSYAEDYGIPGAKTFFRGTIRYEGSAEIFDSLNLLGLLDDAPNPMLNPKSQPVTWNHVMKSVLNATELGLQSSAIRRVKTRYPDLSEKSAIRINRALEWLGLYSDAPVAMVGNLLDALCVLLEEKLQYAEGERDLVILRHNFVIKSYDGKQANKASTLVVYGDEKHSAMAKTVGFPVAVATKLILDGHIVRKGVLRPLTPDIYNPLLRELSRLGITSKEEVLDV